MRHFIKDFQITLKNYFSNMPTDNSNDIVKYALSSSQNLEAAYEAYKAFPSVLEEIAKKFTERLIDRLYEKYGKDLAEVTKSINGDRINISFRKKSWINGTYCSLKDHDRDRLYLSIQTDVSKSEAFYSHLKEKIIGRPNSAQWWDYPTRFNKWTNSYDEIKLMDSNVSVDFFFEELEKLIACVDNYTEVLQST
jgi:hypothetical protein